MLPRRDQHLPAVTQVLLQLQELGSIARIQVDILIGNDELRVALRDHAGRVP